MANLKMIEDIAVAEKKEASFFGPYLHVFMGCFKVERGADEGSVAIARLGSQPEVCGHGQGYSLRYVASWIDPTYGAIKD